MATQTASSKRWITPLIGIALILIGCIQLVLSTVAIVSAIGAAGVEVLVLIAKALFSVTGGSREVETTDRAERLINSAADIGVLGYILAASAVMAGILVLRNKKIAAYVVAAASGFAFLLAYRHLLVAWYVVSAVYAVLGAVFAAVVVLRWPAANRRPPDSDASKSQLE